MLGRFCGSPCLQTAQHCGYLGRELRRGAALSFICPFFYGVWERSLKSQLMPEYEWSCWDTFVYVTLCPRTAFNGSETTQTNVHARTILWFCVYLVTPVWACLRSLRPPCGKLRQGTSILWQFLCPSAISNAIAENSDASDFFPAAVTSSHNLRKLRQVTSRAYPPFSV